MQPLSDWSICLSSPASRQRTLITLIHTLGSKHVDTCSVSTQTHRARQTFYRSANILSLFLERHTQFMKLLFTFNQPRPLSPILSQNFGSSWAPPQGYVNKSWRQRNRRRHQSQRQLVRRGKCHQQRYREAGCPECDLLPVLASRLSAFSSLSFLDGFLAV